MARCISMTADLVLNAAWALVPVVILVAALRPLSNLELSSFVNLYGVPVTEETAIAMTRSLRRSKIARRAGLAVGLMLYPVLTGLGLRISDASILYGVIGYLLGAFSTALVPGSDRIEIRRASLVPRRIGDYVPGVVVVMLFVSVAVSSLAFAVYELEPHRVLPSFSGSPYSVAISAIAAVATLVAIRKLVTRSQPIATTGLVAVDDALRTQAIHTIAAAGIAVAFIGSSSSLLEMGGYAALGWLHVAGGVAGLCSLAGAWLGWRLRLAAWRVTRFVTP